MKFRMSVGLMVSLAASWGSATAEPLAYFEQVPTITIDAASESWRTIKFAPSLPVGAKRIVLRSVSVLCTFVNSNPAVLPHVFFDLRSAPDSVLARVPFSQISVIEDAGDHYKYSLGNSALYVVVEPKSTILLSFIGNPTPPDTLGKCEVSLLGETIL